MTSFIAYILAPSTRRAPTGTGRQWTPQTKHAREVITPRILTDYALRDNLAFPVFSSTLAGITVLFPPGGMRSPLLLPVWKELFSWASMLVDVKMHAPRSKRRPLSEYPRETLFAWGHFLPQARRSTLRRQRESELGDSVVLDALTWLEARERIAINRPCVQHWSLCRPSSMNRGKVFAGPFV
jgi:hypothetical protein